MSIEPRSTHPHTVTFREPGEIIAAVPAMIGFIPERSLVLMAFDAGGSRVGVTMRHDLVVDTDGIPTESMDAMITHLCEICLRERTSGVFAFVIDDRFDIDDPCWEALFADIDDRLYEVGLGAGFVVGEMADGAPWRTAWGSVDRHGFGGILGDPRSSTMAVAQAITSGRVLLRSRTEMVQSTAPGPHCAEPGCGYRASSHRAAAERICGGIDDTELLRRVLDAVLDGVDAQTTCAEMTVLDTAIRRVPVRDALLALAVSEVADPAEALWAELTRRLRGKGRACAATLLGHLHYMRGDGAMAGVALDAALDADAGYSLAMLLDRSLRGGMRPETLAELTPSSYAAAERLGVTMPAPIDRGVC